MLNKLYRLFINIYFHFMLFFSAEEELDSPPHNFELNPRPTQTYF